MGLGLQRRVRTDDHAPRLGKPRVRCRSQAEHRPCRRLQADCPLGRVQTLRQVPAAPGHPGRFRPVLQATGVVHAQDGLWVPKGRTPVPSPITPQRVRVPEPPVAQRVDVIRRALASLRGQRPPVVRTRGCRKPGP